ncbi:MULTISPECIES: hypothetical protein [unclassified Modestobacter]|uniref:hypothetical protein n=1 Tax=unclassified Modestobacter TaxID=2643866 RepID=UPI0022AA12E4|nr:MULTISPECIES: hypothetical protein [unclassified Modestobacter]MCZ2826017.1 hypothetical protein [Modestobacter sp. VKM Ac-2981]MCZ2852918.1 hypothetical protein [Modestobacter sp. VKM Ac-2982]
MPQPRPAEAHPDAELGLGQLGAGAELLQLEHPVHPVDVSADPLGSAPAGGDLVARLVELVVAHRFLLDARGLARFRLSYRQGERLFGELRLMPGRSGRSTPTGSPPAVTRSAPACR